MKKLGLLLVGLLLSSWAFAATTPNSVVTPQTPSLGLVTSNGANNVTVYTAGTNGSLCTGMWATNTNAGSAFVWNVFITRSATNYLQTTVNVPLSSGNTAAAPTVNFFSAANWPGLPLDNYGNAYLWLKSGDTLTATPTGTAATSVQLTAVCADF